MVITVPDSAPLLELQQSTDPIGVQLSFDETSYNSAIAAAIIMLIVAPTETTSR